MFQINDTIIYGSEGVCRIVAIEEKNFVGVNKNYYVIKPVEKDGLITYVPLDSEILVSRMRKLLSKEEINELIDSLPEKPMDWISNERERKEEYKKLLLTGDRVELLKMIHAVHIERQSRESMNKRLHIADEHFLKEAEQCIYSEFRYVLEIEQEEIIPYIIARIDKKEHNYL